jgi:hypothetical protein
VVAVDNCLGAWRPERRTGQWQARRAVARRLGTAPGSTVDAATVATRPCVVML